MADTTTQDNRIAKLNARLTELQADKATLEAVSNPNEHVQKTINMLESKIQRTQAQITNAENLRTEVINRYNAEQARITAVDADHGTAICDLVEKYM